MIHSFSLNLSDPALAYVEALNDETARLSHVHLVILGVNEGEEDFFASFFWKLLVFYFLNHGTSSSGKCLTAEGWYLGAPGCNKPNLACCGSLGPPRYGSMTMLIELALRQPEITDHVRLRLRWCAMLAFRHACFWTTGQSRILEKGRKSLEKTHKEPVWIASRHHWHLNCNLWNRSEHTRR
jgi:hypothetical protein